VVDAALPMTDRTDLLTVPPPSGAPVRLAVLGDSDSHSYHDRIRIPEGTPHRGGRRRETTWQWTEMLERLRGRHFDQGQWGIWGAREKIARACDWVGIPARAPRKEDYQYNFAVSGAESQDLMLGRYRQAPRLVNLMRRDPRRWRDGIVVIRIGVNSIGKAAALDRFATEGLTAAVTSEVLTSADWIMRAVDVVRAAHPHTRFVLVGILDNVDWPPYFRRWLDRRERENIAAALDLFDNALRSAAGRDSRITFVDDRAWFRSHWGARGGDGRPAYRCVSLGGRAIVSNTQGDEPVHAVLADGHAGAVWSGLWAQNLVAVLNASFGLAVPPISTDEIAVAVDPDGTLELRQSLRK
jgi:hypothetical protein